MQQWDPDAQQQRRRRRSRPSDSSDRLNQPSQTTTYDYDPLLAFEFDDYNLNVPAAESNFQDHFDVNNLPIATLDPAFTSMISSTDSSCFPASFIDPQTSVYSPGTLSATADSNKANHDFTLYPSPQPTTTSPDLSASASVQTTTATPNNTLTNPNSTESRPNNKRPSPISSCSIPQSKSRRREANTLAARRYRQKKVDRVNELETALEAVSRERDELRFRLAGAEAEVRVLRGMGRGEVE